MPTRNQELGRHELHVRPGSEYFDLGNIFCNFYHLNVVVQNIFPILIDQKSVKIDLYSFKSYAQKVDFENIFSPFHGFTTKSFLD